jgi:hypothetical protein
MGLHAGRNPNSVRGRFWSFMQVINFRAKSALSGIILMLCICNAFADRREVIIADQQGAISSHPSALVFIYENRIGIVLAYSQKDAVLKLFSFSTQTGALADEFDLKADFGLENEVSTLFAALKAQSQTGTLIAYGLGANNTQSLVCLWLDQSGHFTKRWATSYPDAAGMWAEPAFNDAGSRVYTIHNQMKSDGGSVIRLQLSLDLLHAENGSLIDRIDLEGIGQTIFSNPLNENVVITAGSAVHLLNSANDRFSILAKIGPPSTLAVPYSGIGLTLSQNGNSLLTYAGHVSAPPSNLFIAYDLQLKRSHLLTIPNLAEASTNTNVYSPMLNLLFVPLYQSRIIHIITLGENSALQHLTDVTLPKRSPNGPSLNFISENNVALSPSGAIGFIALNSGLIYSFDALTGEILDTNIGLLQLDVEHYLQLIGQQNATLVSRDGSNKIVLADVETAPLVEEVKMKKKRTSIKGKNFLSGIRVQINGIEVERVERSLDDPGHEITISLGRKNFSQGQKLRITLINHDGLISAPYILQL